MQLHTGRVPRKRRIRLALLLLGQAALWVLLTAAFAMLIQVAGFAAWGDALTFSATNWLPWAVLAPIVFWLARRFPIERGQLLRSVPVHVIACGACSFAMLGVGGYFAPWPRPRPPGGDFRSAEPRSTEYRSGGERREFGPMDAATMERIARERRERFRLARTPSDEVMDGPATVQMERSGPANWSRQGRFGSRGQMSGGPGGTGNLPAGVVGRFWPPFSGIVLRANANAAVYLIIACFAHAFAYYRRAQQRETEAVALNAGLARAKLDALRLQLQPHFLFNTLNAISTLVHRDAAAADELIGDLSELLRLSLQTADHEVPLSRELELLDCYLAIEQTRLGDRLRVVREIDPATRGAWVPTFLLQPLAENAIRHGIEPRRAPGTLTVRAVRDGPLLRLSVADDGVGLKAGVDAGSRRGIGLANTEQRLRALHGEAARLELHSPETGGVRVDISLPVRLGPGTAPTAS